MFLGVLAFASGCSSQVRSMMSSSALTNPFLLHFGQQTKPSAAGGDDWVNAVTTDSAGNIYAVGATKANLGGIAASGWDGFVMKVSAGGTVEWLTQMDSRLGLNSVAGDETPRAVIVVGDFVYVSGYTTGSLAETIGGGVLADAFLSKFTTSGAHVWTKQLGFTTVGAGASATDNVWAMTSDGTSIYIGGQTSGNLGEARSGGTDAWIAKFDASGGLTWRRQIGAPTVLASAEVNAANLNEYVETMDVDAAGNIYVGVYTQSAFKEVSRGSYDAAIVKYTPAGAITSVFHLGATTLAAGVGTGSEQVESLKVDRTTGDIYISGSTTGKMGAVSGGSYDCYVAKVSPAGAFTASWQLTANASGSELDCRMARDSNGNILMTAYTASSLFDTLSGAFDGIAVKLDSGLNFVWGRQFGVSETFVNSAGTGDYLFSIATDVAGNLIMGGGTYGNFGETANNYGIYTDLLIVRLNTAGELY
jgi:hypothetical protein